jgi:hypothetical protein
MREMGKDLSASADPVFIRILLKEQERTNIIWGM